jgi:regulator of nonsense transcripts 2
MMSESLESRKFERKGIFDIPLPMRRSAREGSAAENPANEQAEAPQRTMAFSLMTKKGNKQQVRLLTPSNSQE